MKPVNKNNVNKYLLSIEEWEGELEVYLLKHKGDMRISIKRAIEWAEAGMQSFDGRSKEQMLEILNKNSKLE